MTPDPNIRIKSFATIWVLVFAGCFASAALVYVLAPATGGYGLLSWLLWPGIGLYTLLNGSLLFGGGFGQLGDFFLVTAGSAVTWSLLVAPVVFLGVRIRRSNPQ